MDISYYETRDVDQKKKHIRNLWNVCKVILAIVLLILAIYGGTQYLMQELM